MHAALVTQVSTSQTAQPSSLAAYAGLSASSYKCRVFVCVIQFSSSEVSVTDHVINQERKWNMYVIIRLLFVSRLSYS